MTNSSQNPPPEPNQRRNLWASVLRITRHPATLVIGVSVVAIAAVGYAAARYFIYQQLSPLLEAELSKLLKRPVDVGEVESLAWTLNRVRIGASSLPATASDRDRLSLQSIEVGFNPFPLLLGQPLPIEIAIDDPNIYLDQDKTGRWIDLELEQREAQELPIDLDINVRIRDGDIALRPYGATRPVPIQLNGGARYIDGEKREISYGVDATVLNSQVNAKGKTVIETGKTQVELAVEKLALAELVSLIPNSPVKLNRGNFDTNLNVSLPSFDRVEKTRGQGNLNLQQIEAKIESIEAPVRADLALSLQGQKVFIEEARASIDKVVDTRIVGEVDWEKGLNLNVRVNPVDLSSLLRTISVTAPVRVDGELQANLQLRGAVENPLVTGTISNTKSLEIDKTRIRQIDANFQVDLDKIVLQSLQIQPSAGGQILAHGTIETSIRKALEDNQSIDVAKMPLSLNLRAQLPTREVLAPYYRLPKNATIGRLTAQAQVRGTFEEPVAFLKWQAPRATTPNVDIAGRGEVLLIGKNILVRNTVLWTDEGQAVVKGRGNLDSKKWQAVARANAISLAPFLSPICAENPSTYCSYAVSTNPNLETANVLLSGRLDSFDPATLEGVAALTVRAEKGLVAIRSELSKGAIAASVVASQISLNPFLSNLAAPVNIRQTRVNLSGSLKDLLQGSTIAARNFQADVDALLDVADGEIVASGKLEDGLLEAVATTGQISLTKLLPNLGFSTQVRRGQINLTGNLAALVASLDSNPDVSSFKATADARLAVANGIVAVAARLNNNLWQTDILANNLNTSQILDRIQPNFKQQNLANLDGLVSLSGRIAPLFQDRASLPVKAETIALRLRDRTLNLNADGMILVSNPFSAPDLASNLNVKANSDLDRLPLTELIALVPVRRSFLPQRLDVTGDGQFQGRLAGKNLLSAPTAPGNFLLAGNLRLEDFTLNDRSFDPVLSGPVTVAPGREIALNLQGEDDTIAANLDPCTRRNCPAPYWVSFWEVRQTTEGLPEIVSHGRQIGDRLVAQVENFPLELLSIAPAEDYGILGTIEGQLSANLDFNLFTLTGRGDIAIDRPRIGNRQGRAFNASFTYENNIAQLNSAVLQLDKSRYEGQGAINLASGAIRGRLKAEEGYMEDVLGALQIYDLPTLVSFLQFQKPDYAAAEQVQPESRGNANASIAEQVNRLWAIDKKIRKLVAQREAGGVPTELNIRGAFDTTITVDGTLQNPQINFQFQGNNWEWHPQPTFATIVEPLGLVTADTQIIPIDNIVLQGSLQNGIVRVEPARVQIRDSIASFAGGFIPATQSLQPSELVVENLSVDTVNSFIQLPADIAGNLKARAALSGNLLAPKIQGEYRFTDASFGGRLIERTLAGNFNYVNSRLEFRTTDDSAIQLYASVPYPTAPETNDRVAIDLKLGTAALSLMEIFTQGQVSWLGGEGEVALQASGRLDLSEGFRMYDLTANGRALLQDATLRSAALPEPLNVNAQIALDNQLLRVEQLEGTFAQSRLTAAGVLPLFTPLSRQDPNAANPLTIAIEQGQIDLENLYRGGIDGRVTVTGAAIVPLISGRVRLSDGQVFVPQQQAANNTQAIPIVRQPASPPRRNDVALFVPRLDNLQVALERLSVDAPLYRFDFGGALALSGPVNDLNNLQPQGTITLNRGRVSFLETRFLLDRRYRNVIVFNRRRGLLDPDLDLRMRTIVSDFPNARQQRTDFSNEIPDDNLSRVRRIDITLSVEGQLSQLVPGLGRNIAEVCQIQPASLPPIPGQRTLSQQELQRLQTCLQAIAARGQSNAQLLSNPAVDLSSNPSRTDGEIVRLLGEQFFSVAEVLQNLNTDQLLEYGLIQLALPMALQGVVYDVENTVGNLVGSSDLRLFPLIQTSYRVSEDSFVGVSYDYTFNEFKVEYQTRF
ncbi:hypothetical protein Ple7327_1838 [Pleurocapsa sp. PCC 7327]|uniref:translocation/assembly module TamB domain-containing protein n=1 Tax=Pleurocapsa sp. PCC 7327 TaxID=118163 RepID=UPI00029FE94E|nr:translocation/assembly module TamB domain-containing protein [Pleurocapsa sp. PCC 7327]AFY77185.1 hypothetical protein Ple7327_1838 [Pleurocapsa sp. PCC 7327]